MRWSAMCGVFVVACAGAGDAKGPYPWETSDSAGSSGESGGDETSGVEPPSTSGNGSESGSDPSASSDPTSAPGCVLPEDCPVGQDCIDGSCVPIDDVSTGEMCLHATDPCTDTGECCGDLLCGNTSLGQVCCGWEGESCSTENGEDCCGNLACVDGQCGYAVEGTCSSPCDSDAPPSLHRERLRLENIGGSFLGICGDVNHTYGFHLPAALLPSDDYSLEGPLNAPACDWHAAAIDIGMDWPASRDWLHWLIEQRIAGNLPNVAEVIGSFDGVDVRYWSDSAGWTPEGDDYGGTGHDTWTHVSVYRSTTYEDPGILFGWTGEELLP